MRFDLSGRIALELLDPDERTSRYVTAQLDPFAPSTASSVPVGVVVERLARPPVPTELQYAADDGLVTASDGTSLFVRWDVHLCRIPDSPTDRPARFGLEAGFPTWRMFRDAIRPALQLALPAVDAVALHGAAVTTPEGAIVVTGWSESGKTETALGLVESGAAFLSDKWTIVGADAEASAFPIGVGVRRWVLAYLPTLRAAMPRVARLRFAGVGLAGVVLGPAGRLHPRSRLEGAAVDTARQAMALGDRAGFSVRELRAAYGQIDDPARRAPLRAVVLLRTAPDGVPVTVERAAPDEAAVRLARTAAYERRGYLALWQRAGYALPGRPTSVVDGAVERDQDIIRRILARVPVLLVRAPFPTDPRPVADAIRAAL